jgi:NADPH-dependent curcumin reductase CurA
MSALPVQSDDGAVGTFAVQLARAYGSERSRRGCPEKVDVLRSIGADQVQDFEARVERHAQQPHRRTVSPPPPGTRPLDVGGLPEAW